MTFVLVLQIRQTTQNGHNSQSSSVYTN